MNKMTTITINKRTKAGKILLEMAKLLSEKEKSVIIEDNSTRYNKETEKAISDVRAGKATPVTIEDFRKELYS